MEKIDFKKAYKDLYRPSQKPIDIVVPSMNFIMIDGQGDPNTEPAFQEAVKALYAVAFTIKMLPKKGIIPEGFFDYVVPPLEGLWWLKEGEEFSFDKKDKWLWTMMIRQPQFVREKMIKDTLWDLINKKDNKSLAKIRFETFEEGQCVQAMHIGQYATELETIAKIETFIRDNGYQTTFYKGGKHHEIYLSDPRRCKPEGLKTVLRYPVEKVDS